MFVGVIDGVVVCVGVIEGVIVFVGVIDGVTDDVGVGVGVTDIGKHNIAYDTAAPLLSATTPPEADVVNLILKSLKFVIFATFTLGKLNVTVCHVPVVVCAASLAINIAP